MRQSDLLLIGFGSLLLMLYAWLVLPAPAQAACQMTAVESYNPTGMEGCTLYGEGIASRWPGPGVARNDCLYPWTECTPISIRSLDTGRTVTVVPRMFCDCWTGTSEQRLVDLDPSTLRALGLDPVQGLYPVEVLPATPSLPDTALQ